MPKTKQDSPVSTIQISIIIPMRNEENTICELLEDISNQTLDFSLFQVIIIDDNSEDNSKLKVERFKHKFDLLLLDSPLEPSSSPKKRAINLGIALATGELIVTTDADCRVGKNWLKTIFDFYTETNHQLISGPVTFINTNKIFNNFQIIEFSSLVGVGAVSMYLKTPNMCNGANLAYTKHAFNAVNGFEGNQNLASGDDEFLMHKIASKFPNQIGFLKSVETIVRTGSNLTISDFINQRKRWASKWANYQDWKISALAFFVFIVNFSTIYLIGKAIFFQTYSFVLLIKMFSELFFLVLILHFLNLKNDHKNNALQLKRFWVQVLILPLVQCIYPFYVIFVGIIAQKKGYTWKNRKLQ